MCYTSDIRNKLAIKMSNQTVVIVNSAGNQYRKFCAPVWYNNMRGAKAAATSLNKKNWMGETWVAMTNDDFEMYHNPLVEVIALLTGKKVMIRKSERGGCCDPSMEIYYSM